jgi:hypothetical protein
MVKTEIYVILGLCSVLIYSFTFNEKKRTMNFPDFRVFGKIIRYIS